jgi:GDP-4-dehydro-6-deoxy-D-mannose reductase
MNVLVTGAAGFVGSHMIEYILRTQPECTAVGADRWHARRDNIRHLDSKFRYIEYDMTDYASTLALVAETRPERVFHLAAQSFVPASWNAPADTLTTNITGQLNLFEAVRQIGLDPTIQIACSSEEYGMVYPEETPIKETNPLRPLSPYGVSKVAQDLLGYQYHASYGLRVIRTRAFNHTGPRRGEQFVTSSFAKQIAEVEAGRRAPVIKVGNLDAERDFTDVRDMVRAYWTATQHCEPGEVYNICSGNRVGVRDVLTTLVLLSPLAKDITIEKDETRMRPSDVPLLYGDATKFRERTGWEPRITFKQTMTDLLDYWRAEITMP